MVLFAHWRGVRVVECTAFEKRQAARPRGFESLPLRQITKFEPYDGCFFKSEAERGDVPHTLDQHEAGDCPPQARKHGAVPKRLSVSPSLRKAAWQAGHRVRLEKGGRLR